MLNRILAENIFVTLLKSNTVYETIDELDLTDGEHEYLVKDELIRLSSPSAIKSGINEHTLRVVHVYKEDNNKVIAIVTNLLTWDASTIAELYKKRWEIELFFKAIKQNLQIKTFVDKSKNAVKPQIYVALISYLLVELTRRTIPKAKPAFTTMVANIRMTLCQYLILKYIYNNIRKGARCVRGYEQLEIQLEPDLFSG